MANVARAAAQTASTAKKAATAASKGANYVAVSNSPTATNAAKAKAKATYLQSKADLAVALAIKKACSITDRIKIAGSTKEITFRDKVKNKTGIDVYALGNAALAFGGAVSSVAAMGLGILAAPETGGASLALTAFAFGSLTFACSDFQQHINDIKVGQDGNYRYGTDKHSYNPIYDGLFKKNDSAYNSVRNFVDIGTIIFSLGTAYTVAAANKSPANVIKNVAGKNKGTVVSSSNSVDEFIEQNVAPDFQKSVKNAFSSDAKVTTLSKDTTVYRYYGDGANPKSYWYTPNKTSNPVGDLALPGQNSAQYVEKHIIPKGTTVLEGTVAPNFGQPGGGYQYYVPDSSIVK